MEATLSLIDGKWKGVILFHLLDGPVRFNEIRRRIQCLTQRMLTAQLRELEADGLVVRTVYPQVPPKVEYSLSLLGESLTPVFHALGAWGEAHMHLFGPKQSTETDQSGSRTNGHVHTESIKNSGVKPPCALAL